MDQITLNAYAKINLFLEVHSRLDNGYHNISSVMQSITLCDTIRLESNASGDITLDCTDTFLPCNSDNLAYRAASLFFEAFRVNNNGLHISIDKRIPVSAGLAGGSADAAAVLIGLNKLYSMALSDDELCKTGAKLGADVPFCIIKKTTKTEGIGDIFTPCSPLPYCHIVIAKGKESISTPWAYSEIDKINDRIIRENNMPELLYQGDLKDICNGLYNCFERVVLHVEQIKRTMLDQGATGALMSGSGPSVFGIFDNKTDAERTCEILRNQGLQAFACEPYEEKQ